MCSLLLLLVGLQNPIQAAEHPGCGILWFLKGCPLAKIFGVDPFDMYNWNILCPRYSDLKDLPQCTKILGKEGDDDDDGLVETSPRDESEVLKGRNLDKREVPDHTGHLFPSHPGCTHFWFLPGCPLGALTVDPFNHYPWEALCKYPRIQDHAKCKLNGYVTTPKGQPS